MHQQAKKVGIIMKKLILAILLSIFCFLTSIANADVAVNGYYRSNGTYVQPHYRSDPNGTPNDNWSTKGNVNPYTGQPGYKNPDAGYNQDNYNSQNQRLQQQNNNAFGY